MKVKALITLIVNGKSHLPPAVVEIADDEAESLITRGFAEHHGPENAPKPSHKPANTNPAPTLEDIIDAIGLLDPAKDFGKNGKPNVEALEDLLDANITAAQRDEAWEAFQKAQEDDGAE